MRQVYIEEIINKAASDSDDYIYSEKVKPGKILVITRVALWWSDIGAAEVTMFFVEDMGRKLYFKDDKPAGANTGTYSQVLIAIGEGDRVGGYNSDIATGDEVHLSVFGELWDAEDWQKRGERSK